MIFCSSNFFVNNKTWITNNAQDKQYSNIYLYFVLKSILVSAVFFCDLIAAPPAHCVRRSQSTGNLSSRFDLEKEFKSAAGKWSNVRQLYFFFIVPEAQGHEAATSFYQKPQRRKFAKKKVVPINERHFKQDIFFKCKIYTFFGKFICLLPWETKCL